MLTDFRNSFNVGFCNKCATRFLYFPPHLKHVTTLPCETSAAGFQQVTNDVRGRDEVRENELDIRRCCGKYVRFLLFFDLLYFIKHSPKLCLKIELHVFYRAMRCISAVFAVMQCLSVRLSVRHVRGSRQNE